MTVDDIREVALPDVAASVSTTPRIGPIHGDQAIENAEPIANERG